MRSRARNLLAVFATLAFVSAINFRLSTVFAQGTAFTYQGQLYSSGSLANGSYDLKLTLFDAVTNGSIVAGPITNTAVPVTNGLFTTVIDFGEVFDGNVYWLRIQVETNGAANFTTLSPRQQLTPAPYAEFATTASNLSGIIPISQLPSSVVTNNESSLTLGGTFSGNGAGLTNVNATALNGLTSGSFWQLGGNNVTNGQFIGSVNSQPLEIWVGGQRALRLEPINIGAPNVIGGSPINSVSNGIFGATIAGGGVVNFFGSASSNSVANYFGTVGGGLGNTASGVGATVSGGGNNIASGQYAYVGGFGNTASGLNATISGGNGNAAAGQYAAVNGGNGNSAPGNYDTVGGGNGNIANHVNSFVGGGQFNTAAGNADVVAGGQTNNASGPASTVGGGQNNSATANSAVVAGGDENSASSQFSTVGGGFDNSVSGEYGIIAGGNNNLATGTSSTVAGGYNNNASGQNSAIGGGGGNLATDFGSVVGGGWINQASFDYSTVAGGESNLANGIDATVGGGYLNIATNYSTIAGGYQNQATGQYSTIAGGVNNFAFDFSAVGGGSDNFAHGAEATVGGGQNNEASGQYAAVPGGYNNLALGANSFAAGFEAVANNTGSFVWSDGYYGSLFQDTGPDQFLIHAQGGVGINWVNPTGDTLSVGGTERMNNYSIFFRGSPDTNHGVGYFGSAVRNFAGVDVDGPVLYGYSGGALGTEQNGSEHIAVQWTINSVTVNGTFNNNSDRNAKQDFAPVSAANVLEKVTQLPISEWSYKTDMATRHVGPMAQDFYSAFSVGTDERHIAPIDEGGVALAAIQGLNEKVEGRSQKEESQIEQLKSENAELKARLERLEQLMKSKSIGGN